MPEIQPPETVPENAPRVINLDNLPKGKHNWVVRGDKVNCEGATHPFHEHFLINLQTLDKNKEAWAKENQ